MPRDEDTLADRALRQELRGTARWLGLGIAVGPSADVVDRYGLLTGVATMEMTELVAPVALLGLFAALGVGAAAILPHHSARGRGAFFAACAIPVVAWVVWLGLSWVGLIAVLALGLAGLRLRGLGV